MNRCHQFRFFVTATFLAGFVTTVAAQKSSPDNTLASHLQALQAVGKKGEGHRAATAAWKHLSQTDATQITEVLAGMDGANELATNWIRAAVDAIAERQLRSGGKLPTDSLEEFLIDTKHAPRARRAAYEWLRRVDASAEGRLIPELMNDPSAELRRDAVEMTTNNAAKLLQTEKKEDAILGYRSAFRAARDIDQIQDIADTLKDLDQTVNLPRHFGFLLNWHLIAPFDNSGMSGFDTVYPPEEKVDLQAEYQGKGEVTTWAPHTTDDEFGTVDLNATLGKIKGAIAYAYTEFSSAESRNVDLRLGCINGNKIWLNGELVMSNHVYHASTAIDQYKVKVKLKKGSNAILVKIAQNEQEEGWAQRWQFQLRVCDQYGTAVLSTDREKNKTALLD